MIEFILLFFGGIIIILTFVFNIINNIIKTIKKLFK